MSIQKITRELLQKIIDECMTESNIKKIEKSLIDPLIHYTFSRMYPYLLGTTIIFILTFLLAIIILIILIRINCFKPSDL